MLLDLIVIAREHRLITFTDEVYDKIVVYGGLEHAVIGVLSEDVITITCNSLSKSYRSCGYRAGWMAVSGPVPQNDQQFILDLLLEERVLLVQGTGFNWTTPDHFRVVFLPNLENLADSTATTSAIRPERAEPHGTHYPLTHRSYAAWNRSKLACWASAR